MANSVGPQPSRPVAEPATSPEKPWPVRTVAQKIGMWVSRLGWVWVEGQVAQVSQRPGAAMAFLTLRDPAADVSLGVTCSAGLLRALPASDTSLSGAHVVVHAKPSFYLNRGTLSLAADEIRPVGVGSLLLRLEQLKKTLAAEGLFAAERKKSLPFLPAVVGLISGRASAAQEDVLSNTRRRWPAVRFRSLEVAVQGPSAVTEVVRALQMLDADPDVEVIVIARGGGGVEDLLPFSNEALIRAVSGCRTPVVSAIGHEVDTPLLDLVADVRASTPTDAAKRIVPDVAEQLALVAALRERARRAVADRVDREAATLAGLRTRPSLASPDAELRVHAERVETLRERLLGQVRQTLDRATSDLTASRAHLRALSPAATLDRGYAVVHGPVGNVLRSPDEVASHDRLRVRLKGGELSARVE